MVLGTPRLAGDLLHVETQSAERGRRARRLVESLAGPVVRHRSTSHEDLRRQVLERLRDDVPERRDEPPEATEPELEEAVLGEYARHYRRWLDEPVPALEGRTPRQASGEPALRPRLEELLGGLTRMYEQSLKQGRPAYDASWMREELGLEDGGSAQPLLLAHERIATRHPPLAAACRALADRLRERGETFADAELTSRDLELRRALHDGAGEAAAFVPLLVNLELHRRKTFQVDAPLVFLLERTDVDLSGRELRVPFPSFVVAFTDRHALSLGERLLARRAGDPLRGQVLRAITVFVTEHVAAGRTLRIALAIDALGADLPSLVVHHVPAGEGTSLEEFLSTVSPAPADPERRLLRLVLGTILYATSAGVEPVLRPRGPGMRGKAAGPESDQVYFLPGTIDIRRVRALAELERAPGGRALLARFLVRGHWRRAPATWSDQRLRWIEPYWKGPDLAAVIEKAYRLRA